MAAKDKDIEKIQDLVKVMKDHDLVEIEIRTGDDKIHLKRAQEQAPVMAAMPAMQPMQAAVNAPVGESGGDAAAQSAAQSGLLEIKSPLVGTFYAQPSPDADSFVEVGSQVEEQSVVCIIEAMKVMNEIKSEFSGTIAEVCVKSGEAVEYGQVLYLVKPD